MDKMDIIGKHYTLIIMAHKFTHDVFHPTNGSFLHTSCENCGVVVGQSDQPCPHPVAPVQPGNISPSCEFTF